MVGEHYPLGSVTDINHVVITVMNKCLFIENRFRQKKKFKDAFPFFFLSESKEEFVKRSISLSAHLKSCF